MEPITRKEKFLAKAGGQNIELPNPVTREEMFLAAIGGGGKFVVYIMEDDNGNLVCDKTFEEIEAAMETQTVVLDFFGTELLQDGGVQGKNYHFAGAAFVGLPVIVCYRVKITNDGAVEVSEEGYDLSSLKM